LVAQSVIQLVIQRSADYLTSWLDGCIGNYIAIYLNGYLIVSLVILWA